MYVCKISIQDLPAVAALFDQYRMFYQMESDLLNAQTFLLERLNNNDSVIFVAKSAEGIVMGFVQLYPLFSSTRMKRLWLLNDLFVDSKFRGMKVSITLIDRAKQLAKETNAAGLILETAKSNTIGNALYSKTDFILDADHNYYTWN
jgi:ribosomal protein S18 acetylase RimI-like enzyme